jgi:CRISPR-associated protein Csb2
LQTTLLCRSSHKWISITPFIPTRHYKERGQKRDTCGKAEFPVLALQEELARLKLPKPRNITFIPEFNYLHAKNNSGNNQTIPWNHFRQSRFYGNGRKGNYPGNGFIIEFDTAVPGPIACGYGSHFGLGLFLPLT